MHKALFSIKPWYIDKILSQEKRYEFRRTKCKQPITTMLLYATLPVGAIVGEIAVNDIVAGSPDDIWWRTFEYAGLTREEFESYFNGCKVAYAYQLSRPVKYSVSVNVNSIGITVPQSFCYISEEQYERIIKKTMMRDY